MNDMTPIADNIVSDINLFISLIFSLLLRRQYCCTLFQMFVHNCPLN